MSLEKKVTAERIVIDAGMVPRPGYFSGRGARNCDLNSKILEKIYEGVKTSQGEEAAQNYTQMVADMPQLSATEFLLTLYQLERNNWKWDKSLLGNGKGIDIEKDKDGTHSFIQGTCTIIEIMYGNDRDETPHIRREFLHNRGMNNHPDVKNSAYAYINFLDDSIYRRR